MVLLDFYYRDGNGALSVQFKRHENFYRIDRVTGPTHNFLGLRFVPVTILAMEIEAIPGFCHRHDELDPVAILAYVREGLSHANNEFGRQYNVSHIQYRLGDNPPESVYGMLAFKIVEHLAFNREFAEVRGGNDS